MPRTWLNLQRCMRQVGSMFRSCLLPMERGAEALQAMMCRKLRGKAVLFTKALRASNDDYTAAVTALERSVRAFRDCEEQCVLEEVIMSAPKMVLGCG